MESIGDFLTGAFIGVPIIAWLIIAVILFIYFKVNYFSGQKAKADDTTKTEEKAVKAKTKVKKQRRWSLNPFRWLKGKSKAELWDFILFRMLVPIFIITMALLWYYQLIFFTTGELVWIAIIGFVVIVFSTRSELFRKLTTIAAILTVVYFIGRGLYSLNLPGTPHPIKTVEVWESSHFIYDVSEPRWTCYTLDLPDNIVLELEAFGQYHWDSLDSRGPIGPEGAPWFPNQMMRQHHFIPGLLDKPFAGLIGKVGIDGEVFFIGEQCKVELAKGGDLYIGINYRWVRPGGQNWRSNWKNATGRVWVSYKWATNPQS